MFDIYQNGHGPYRCSAGQRGAVAEALTSAFTKRAGRSFAPVNAVTGKPITRQRSLGVERGSLRSPVEHTRLWQSVGAQVRRGERSTLIVFWENASICWRGEAKRVRKRRASRGGSREAIRVPIRAS